MKIAVLHPQFQSGGLDRVMVRLTKGFLQAGHEVDLLTASESGSMYGEVEAGVDRVKLSVPVKLPAIRGLVSKGSWTSLFTVPAFARYLRKHRPNVVLAASSLNGAVLGRAISRTHTPLILRVATHQSASSAEDSHISARALPGVRRRLFRHADAVVTNSEVGAADLQRSLSLDSSRVHMINNPSADPEIAVRAREDVDHRWLNQRDAPIAVTVGRLAPPKDLATLLRALAKVTAQVPCRLLVLGDGVDRADLEGLAWELGLEESVDFQGFVSNPWAYMARSDLFLLSSRWEGSPNSLIEAMTLGVPVVATDCPGGPSEILQGGELGRLVEVGDDEAFAAAWLDVLRQPERARERAVAGSAQMARYDFDHVVGQYLELMESCVGSSPSERVPLS